jgi:DNA-binding transcriptional ArsR family regulator
MIESPFSKEARVYKALAHPVRLEILNLLISSKLDVNDISKILHRRQPNISQHLQILKKVGLVFSNKTGKHHVYQPDHIWIRVLKQILELAI